MHTGAMKMTAPGMIEREVAGSVEGIALARGRGLSFPIIFSVRSEVLHNHSYDNVMQDGQMAVCDAGANSPLMYASDITRTLPVNGRFSDRQRDIYQVVLAAEVAAIEAVRPGVKFRDVHLLAAGVIAKGLTKLGLMRGDPAEAVDAGAHALFFVHGLGHMIGLDVHDMEGYGEDLVGYDDTVKRSDQFGLAYLRLARALQPGFVMTVEPGVYFIPELIDRWRSESRHEAFIDYGRVAEYLGFGGVRIEDDVVVTADGHRVLGPPIPKTVAEVEETMGG
jgi:Xaa-Pro aminopeptidase